MKPRNITSKLLEAREDAAKALEAPEQSFDFVAALVHLPVVFPGLDLGTEWRHDRDEPQIECELTRLVALVGAVHQQVHWPVRAAQLTQQRTAFGGKSLRIPI